ncbi:transcriptional activator RfaH [Salipiger marinus]|uniref:transcription termination/antitermination protein NusG n=1 Tax=Salipiger marinus TaxID=555512 RepID=UPI002B95572E|nr:transcriptional activator RfaH [Salipiger manganoxidans]MEB3421679.1 transcriptional activator RfaH [Salipiger manganoxidans]
MVVDMLSHEDQRWYILQLRPNCLGLALRNLARQSFEVFNPQHFVSVRRSDGFRQRKEQLFPGYLFVSLDPNSGAWRSVNSTRGVARLVSFGGRPTPVPLELMSGLFSRCNQDGELLPPEQLREGDLVRITSGPFADFTTTIETIDKDRRVWVLLDVLGRATRVKMRENELRRA